MGVSQTIFTGFGLRVNLKPEAFDDPATETLKQYIWDNTPESQQDYFSNGIKDMFHIDYYEVENFTDAFPGLKLRWCGNPYFPSVPDTSEWFAFASSTFARITDPVQWLDLSKKSFIPPHELEQLNQLAPIAVDGLTPRWYVVSSLA